MAAFAEIEEGLARKRGLFDCDRFNAYFSSAEKLFALTTGVRAGPI